MRLPLAAPGLAMAQRVTRGGDGQVELVVGVLLVGDVPADVVDQLGEDVAQASRQRAHLGRAAPGPCQPPEHDEPREGRTLIAQEISDDTAVPRRPSWSCTNFAGGLISA